jgi:MFS family permease
MTCVVLFGISSLMYGLAPNLPVLVFFRILQGLGGGGLAPTEQAILADTFPPEKRGQAFSVYAMAVVVAPVIGPTLGGYITDNFSWRWLFLINVPVAVVSLVLSARMLEDPPFLEKLRKKMFSVDYVGLRLLATGIGCLQVALDKGEREDWFASSFIVSFSVIAVVALITAIIWEYHHPNPVLDVRLFKSRTFSVACIMMFMLGAALYGATVLIPQLLQTLMGYTAQQAGMVLSPGGLVIIATMPLIGRLLSKMDALADRVRLHQHGSSSLPHDQLDARHRFQDGHDVSRLSGHRHGLLICADPDPVLHRDSAGKEQQRQRHDQSRAQPRWQSGHIRDLSNRFAARAISPERAGFAYQPVRCHVPAKRRGPHADFPDAGLGCGPRHHHGAPDAL